MQAPSVDVEENRKLFIRRIILTSLGVSLSWHVGSIFDGADSVVAGVMCFITLQISLQNSVKEGLSQVAGSLIGATFAIVLALTISSSTLAIGLVIALSILIAQALRLGPQGSLNVGITALIVLGPGSALNSASDRVLGTAIGVTIGVIISIIMRPDTPQGRTQKALAKVSEELAVLLKDLADGLSSGTTKDNALTFLDRAREINYSFENIRKLSQESTSLAKWNPLASKSEALALASRTQASEHMAIQVRNICRNLLEYSSTNKQLSSKTQQEIVKILLVTSKVISEESVYILKSPKDLTPSNIVDDLSIQIADSLKEIKESDDTQELILGLSMLNNMNIITKSLSLDTTAVGNGAGNQRNRDDT